MLTIGRHSAVTCQVHMQNENAVSRREELKDARRQSQRRRCARENGKRIDETNTVCVWPDALELHSKTRTRTSPNRSVAPCDVQLLKSEQTVVVGGGVKARLAVAAPRQLNTMFPYTV